MQSATTLVDLLRQKAWQRPDQRAYTFLKDGETDAIHLTYAQLDRQARAIAVQLQAMVQPGDRVLLLYPPGLEYISAFFGCLYAGAIAVPAYPPNSSRLERVLPRLQAMIASAQPAAALTTTPILTMMAPGVAQEAAFQQLQWLATDGLDQQQAQAWTAPQVDAASIAFLQYTSGSTALPKGVMVSHGNLLHNQRLIQSAFDHSEQTTVVGWLPLYHDMGLIGNVLQPLYLGTSCVLMSPVAFLQSPIRWLQAISRYGATTSGGPNFAYELCVQKTTVEQRQTLDLSSWRVAFNGAEPVRHDTLAAFTAAFEPYGFRAEAFYPCYGLAESTLFVSGGAASALPTIQSVQKSALTGDRALPAADDETDALSLVSAGAPRFDQSLAIVDPQTGIAREDGHVGEIWVAGPSVAHGYWNRPEESAATFAAHLADTGAGPFLRTGDLGFVRDGELFVTGRLKDLIIIRGRNHYPQDIELTVERSHYALRPGCGAAFSVTVDGEERLVVVQEVERQHRKIDPAPAIQAIRAAVAEQHELQVYGVVLIKPGSLPKTSSGKIQRRACQAKFGAGELEVYGSSLLDASAATAGEATLSRADLMACPAAERQALVERYLKQQIARVLRIAPSEIAPAQSINALGLDSLMAIELQHSVEADLQIVLPMVSFLRDLHIAELAAGLLDQLSRQETGPQRTDAAGADQPLSPGQRALWFLHQLAPESAAYNIANAVRIRSAVDAAALERAFQKLIDRHAALRSVIVAPEGEPIQRVLDQAAVVFQAQDASGWSESALETYLTTETQRPFDLASGPLLRVYLLERSAQEQILVLVLHHIIADLWSLAVLLQELGALYSAERDRTDATLAPLALQYADYVRWQAEELAGDPGRRLWAYWQQQLAGDLPVLQLPTDRPRPPVQTYRGEARSFTLDAALTQQIKQLAQDRGTTLYTLLLTAFQVLLHRYSGQHDILVGSPTAGRTRSQLANVVGYFVNPVVLRADLAGNPAFTALLEQSRQTVLAAFEHQEYPFAWLVERLQAERDPSRSPLFQAMFILQKVQQQQTADVTALALGDPGAQVQLGELVLESLPLAQQTAQFDIALSLAESERGLSGSLQGNADLFDGATLARMAEHFQHLLGAIASNPTQPIAQLELMGEHERDLTLHQWNATAAAYPSHMLLHSLFEAQAARAPEAIAVVGGTETLTYGELNRRANQLAHRLQALGVTAETPVGLCLGRTPDLIVGALAISKAGGCYVPLDPAYPQERLALILQDAQVRVLVTQTALRSYLPDLNIPVIDLSQEQLDSWPEHAPNSTVAADNLAYLIYTSGSTGRPKGVAISHRSAAAFIHWSLATFTADDLAGVLAATSICFDLSIFEIFAPLSSGGSVILAENVLKLPELPAAQRVTLINTVPSAMAELLHLAAIPQSVRVINLAGEALRQDLVQQTQAAAPRCRVFNLYGPSEDTTYSTFALVEPQDATPPIGRPISNTQAYILDAWLRPVPLGVAGELYLAGAGLARGYLQRPELTAEKFLPNPFGDMPGARFYKTGDLVRYRVDGQLEYLGRIDQQVKVRGFRIELGEIEATLRTHPEVREAVVVVNEDASAGKRLVAYVVEEQKNKGTKEQENKESTMTPLLLPQWEKGAGDEGLSSTLRVFLQSRLPEYMIPAAFVVLHQLPRTPSGKLDRRALPAPHFGDQVADAYVAPRTPIETTLAALWAEVLNVARAGIHDNFFALGGHSLIAARLMHRVREAFQLDLPLHSLFETPTVAGLAQRIVTMGQTEQLSAPAIRPTSRTTELPLSFAQQRYWFLDQLIPGSAVYNTPSALRLRGALDVAALERSLNTILERHAALRTTFDVVGGQPVQIINDASSLALPVIDLSAWPQTEREAQRRLVEQARQPFDLTRAPLLRAELLRLADDEHILLLVTHHIAFDGTHNIFYRELSELYRAFTQGLTPDLPVLPVSYADFAVWQREYVAGDVLDTQLSYWTQQLGHDLTPLQLPTDRPRPSVQTFNGARQAIAFPPSLVTALRALSRQANTTLYTTALAAFQLLLHRYSGQDAISVGTPVVNHGRAEAQPLIGSFVNTLVLRSNLAGNPSFGELLTQVQRIAQEGYAHGELPFEMIVEALQPERDLSRNPLFQVMFVLQPDPLQHLDLAHLTASAVEIDTATARFDLLLSLWEGEQSLTGMIEYNTDLFDAGTITRLLSHFQTVLESVSANPELRVRDVPLIPAAERRQMLYDWNATDAGYERDVCLHTLFERQAARTPDAIAVAFEADTRERVRLSYAELNARANQLAHQLQALGIGAGEVVAVYMERSPEMIAAVLGILKAGATYVPLEISFPQARVEWVLARLNAQCIVTSSGQLERVHTFGQNVPSLHHAVCLLGEPQPALSPADGPWIWSRADLARWPETNLDLAYDANQLAYMIFTSGSTGTPKGVMVRHQPVINLIEWVNRTYQVGPSDQILFVTSLCFDLSVYDIFGMLAAGGTIRVASDQDVRDAERLLHILRDERITFWDSAPAALQQLVPLFPSIAGMPGTNALRLVFLSGDWIPVPLPDQVRRTFPNAQVISLGGATEATVWSNYYPIGAVDPSWPSIPYGRPIQNAQYYILDANLAPCPVGVAGDLYIGGECLAEGYAAEPALTAEKFIPDPFGARPGARIYRTGDQASFWPDGTMIFLGRVDHQVKIRGYRIEIGEIETVLRQHPAVRETIVVAREDTPGDKRLVAYVVPRENLERVPSGQSQNLNPEPDGSRFLVLGSDLRAHAAAKLPEYMLPSAFVILTAIPLNNSGKVDRKALPAPDQLRAELSASYAGPRNATEQLLADLWANVLQVEQVGIHDNFFDLGGHSLTAIQIMTEVRSTFQIELPLRNLFEHPTVASLAAHISAAQPLADVPAETLQSTAVSEKSIDELLAEIEQLDDDLDGLSDDELLKLLQQV